MEVFGNLWKAMDFLEIYGNLGKFMEICGNLEQIMNEW